MSYTVSKQAQKYIDEFFGDDEVGRVPEKVNKEQNENTHKVQHFLFPMSEIQYKYPEKRKRKK